jgi:hypothetical protein
MFITSQQAPDGFLVFSVGVARHPALSSIASSRGESSTFFMPADRTPERTLYSSAVFPLGTPS